MVLTIQTKPQVEPVTLQEIKNHLRISINDEDDLLLSYLRASRTHVEQTLAKRALITQTFDYYLQRFPSSSEIILPRPPLQSVTTLKYTDQDGNESTWANTNYIVDTDSEPGRIVLGYGKTWPSDTLYPSNPIAIRFVAGYGDEPGDVPEELLQAIKILTGELYENREESIIGHTIEKVDFTVRALVNSYIIRTEYGRENA